VGELTVTDSPVRTTARRLVHTLMIPIHLSMVTVLSVGDTICWLLEPQVVSRTRPIARSGRAT